jgi:phosphoenolpyruvate carboxykinase (ATP)
MIARDKIVWKRDDFWGYEVPAEIPGLDMSRFDLNNYYSEYQIKKLCQILKKERVEWLSQFSGLDPAVVSALRP